MGNDFLQKGSTAAGFAQRRPIYEELHKNPGVRPRENPNAKASGVVFYPICFLVAAMLAKIGYNVVIDS